MNRTLTEPLRRILRRAETVWLQDVPRVDWTAILLPEPKERIREASSDEEAALLSAIREDYRPAIRFMLVSGCRLEEVVTLTWANVMWTAGALRVVGKGRRGSPDQERLIPITSAIREILWPLKDHHRSAVFTYVAQSKRSGVKPGDRLPMTYEGLKTQWRRDRADSGVANFRLHDTRHTAMTRLVRATGNLKLAQQLAGHADISTTARYAHATLEDLHRGMEAATPQTPQQAVPTRTPTQAKK